MSINFKSILFATTLSLGPLAEARHDFHLNIISVDEVLVSQTTEHEIEIKEDTFLHNIQGYACALPGIQIDKSLFYGASLEHREFYEMGVVADNQALIVKKNQNECFGFPDNAQEVFGNDFLVGSKHKLKLKLERSLVTVENFEGKHVKVLLETLSSNLLGVEIQSSASVSLEKNIESN